MLFWHVLCLDCGALCSLIVPETAVSLFGVEGETKGDGKRTKGAVLGNLEDAGLSDVRSLSLNCQESRYRLVLDVMGGLAAGLDDSRCKVEEGRGDGITPAMLGVDGQYLR